MASVDFQIKDEKKEFIFFFRDEHRFLSNMWPCQVTLEEELDEQGQLLPAMDFDSTENAYMAWKTTCLETRKQIQKMDGKEAKKFAHEEDFPLRSDYSDAGRVEIMRNLVFQKFSDCNPELKKLLLETGNATIMEGNAWGDTFFGFDFDTGEGNNHLGRILMEVRNNLL